MKGPYNGGSSFAPFFRRARRPCDMMDPNPNPRSLYLSLYISARALSAGRFHPLFYYESLSGELKLLHFSSFSPNSRLRAWLFESGWAIFLLLGCPLASRATMRDEKVNRKKRLPSVHRPWDPQRCWWRAGSAGDFGNTTNKGGDAEFEIILYQPVTKILKH